MGSKKQIAPVKLQIAKYFNPGKRDQRRLKLINIAKMKNLAPKISIPEPDTKRPLRQAMRE